MSDSTNSESSRLQSGLQRWHIFRRKHELLAQKRIDAEDRRRESDEYRGTLTTCVASLRGLCLATQTGVTDSVHRESLLQATYGFIKAQERLEQKEQKYNQSISEIIQLEGQVTALAAQVFGQGSQETFMILQRHTLANPADNSGELLHGNEDVTVTEDTDRDFDELEPHGNPVTELLDRQDLFESQILTWRNHGSLGSGRSSSSISDERKRIGSQDKSTAQRPVGVHRSLSVIRQAWQDTSRQLRDCRPSEIPPQDAPAASSSRPESEPRDSYNFELLHHMEIPHVPIPLTLKAKTLGSAMYCRADEVPQIDLDDMLEITSRPLPAPIPLSERLHLGYDNGDVGRVPADAVAAREGLNSWLLSQLMGSEEHLWLYASFLSQTPKVFDMKIRRIRRLINDNWHMDGTQMTQKGRPTMFETTQQRSKQAQQDSEHLSVDFE